MSTHAFSIFFKDTKCIRISDWLFNQTVFYLLNLEWVSWLRIVLFLAGYVLLCYLEDNFQAGTSGVSTNIPIDSWFIRKGVVSIFIFSTIRFVISFCAQRLSPDLSFGNHLVYCEVS